MLLCVWFLIAKMFDQVCFDKCPETAMRILVKGHAPWGVTRVQHKSTECGSVYTCICQILNIHVAAAKIFNVHQINKRAFFGLHYIQIKIAVWLTSLPSMN